MKQITFILVILLVYSCNVKSNKEHSEFDNTSKIEWIDFKWHQDSLGGKFYNKLGIYTPITINDSIIQYTQFDLGANTNMLYETTLQDYSNIYNDFNIDTIGTGSSYYWIRNPNIKIGKVKSSVENWVVRTDYDAEGVIGTIGAEELKNRSLIIDFPNTKMAILDSVNESYLEHFDLFDFEIINNKVILTVFINGKPQRVNFDTGSSITPLFISDSTFYNEITDVNIGSDTLRGFSSWGKRFDYVPGAAIKQSFVVGKKDYKHQMAYYFDSDYHRNLFKQDSIVALVGSVLFFENEILIDFKNKKMGIKQ